MPKKHYKGGVRVNIWIPERYRSIWEQMENGSKFVQIALDDAVGIMTWAILKQTDPEKYVRPVDKKTVEEVAPEFNKRFPHDPITAKRIKLTLENDTQTPWNPADYQNVRKN